MTMSRLEQCEKYENWQEVWNPRFSMSMNHTKGLLNAPGQNNCFLNSAVQVSHFINDLSFHPQYVIHQLVCAARVSVLFSFSGINQKVILITVCCFITLYLLLYCDI